MTGRKIINYFLPHKKLSYLGIKMKLVQSKSIIFIGHLRKKHYKRFYLAEASGKYKFTAIKNNLTIRFKANKEIQEDKILNYSFLFSTASLAASITLPSNVL